MLTTLIESHKAGSPIDSNVYWISLKPCSIVKLFEKQHHIKISNGLVKRLLKELGYGYRKQTKQLALGSYAHRDEQFNIICLKVKLSRRAFMIYKPIKVISLLVTAVKQRILYWIIC